MIKNYLKSYLILFTSLLILTILFTIINYFFIPNSNIFKIIIPIISIFISSIILGKNSKEKAYLEGIKFASIYLIIITIIKLILKQEFNPKVFIIMLSILLTSIIGSMLGINLKKR